MDSVRVMFLITTQLANKLRLKIAFRLVAKNIW